MQNDFAILCKMLKFSTNVLITPNKSLSLLAMQDERFDFDPAQPQIMLAAGKPFQSLHEHWLLNVARGSALRSLYCNYVHSKFSLI